MKAHLKREQRLRNALFKAYKRNTTGASLAAYQAQNRKCIAKSRIAHTEYETGLAQNVSSNTKKFFGHLQRDSRLRHRKVLPQGGANTTICDPESQVNTFANHFRDVFRPDQGTPTPAINTSSQAMPSFMITPTEVSKALESLDPNKGPGPDSLHPAILKTLALFITEPLTALFNHFLSISEIPEDWREAIVCPIHKKGDRQDPGNYRPVSLTSIVCKVMETTLKGAIVDHLQRSKTLATSQHGFVPRRCCLTNLLTAEERITTLMDTGEDVDLVYLDFAKAFDSVNHRMLVDKMLMYGIHRSIVDWTRAFLFNRSFRVRVEGSLSDPVPAVSGVP